MHEPQRTAPRSDPTYIEHVGAPVFIWVLVIVLSVSVGIAYGAAVGGRWGVLAFAFVQALGAWWLLTARAQIRVDAVAFSAGRATLPLEFVGAVVALDSAETRHAAGPGADARAFLLLRGSTNAAVKVILDDPADPTPYWLVGSRRPRELRDALIAAKAAATPTTP